MRDTIDTLKNAIITNTYASSNSPITLNRKELKLPHKHSNTPTKK